MANLSASARQGLKEILRRRVLVCEALHIKSNAVTKTSGSQIILEHGEHCRALGIGDAVERVGDAVGIDHRLGDAARASQRIQLHHREPVTEDAAVVLSVRKPLGGGFVAKPCGE